MLSDDLPSGHGREKTENCSTAALSDEENKARADLRKSREANSEPVRRLGSVAVAGSEKTNTGVSILTGTNRPGFMDNVFDNYENQLWPNKELIIVLNRDDMDIGRWRERAQQHRNVTVYQLPEEKTLGDCLNLAVGKAKHPYLSKFDDDNYYAPYFLTDLMSAFNSTAADIVGKATYYCYLERTGTLALRFPNREHRFVKFLSGAALIIKRSVFDTVLFTPKPAGTDTVFLKECVQKGFKLYSADRFNHVCVRRPNLNEHTWKISEAEFLRKCRIVGQIEDYKAYVTV